MNEDDARRLLRSAYSVPDSGELARRPWIERPAAVSRRRHALMASMIAAVVAVVIALPVGITLALHQTSQGSTPPGTAKPGALCALAKGVTSIEFDRATSSQQAFVFPASVQITSPARIDDLAAALCALQRQAPGVYHCPADGVASVYTARLLDGSDVTLNVTILAGGCPLVYGLGGSGTRLVKDAQTWAMMGLALGIPNATLQTFTGMPATTPTPSVSTATSAPMCRASQVQVSYLIGASGGGAGNTSTVLGIRNQSAQPCELRGWPILAFLGDNGAALPTDEVKSTSDFAQTISVQTVVLQTGTVPFDTTQQMGSAPAVRGYGYISVGSNDVLLPCETATSIRVVLPGFRTSIVVNLEVPPDFPAGQVFCSEGKVQVLPVHP